MKKNFKHIRLPQYRLGDYGYSCATCEHMKSSTEFYCTKYNVEVDPSYVCDSWESPYHSENDEKSK